MSGAMLEGWRSAGVDFGNAVVIRPSGKPVEGLRVVSNYGEAGPSPRLVILGCKPQQLDEVVPRLSAHLNETRHILKKGGQVGKRLDFMMQELNREANTLGAKASVKELADASMELKLLIEQMREQVQNLE